MYSRKTKIVATIGPSSDDRKTLRSLVDAGANVFRLNMSHGSQDHITKVHAAIREVEEEVDRPIGILGDLQGPKLRCGVFDNDQGYELKAGQPFTFDRIPSPGDESRVELPHPEIFGALVPGATILVDDGNIRLTAGDCGDEFVRCRVDVAGQISNRKGVNFPDINLPVAALSDKDLSDLEFLCSLGIDWLALSFVQRPEDLEQAAALVKGRSKLISKIEKPNAVKAFDAILAASDGIMVARGDLGVEMPVETVPPIQRDLVGKCREAGKPVIVATQMLESMVNAPVPTRAEVSDVATAVYDGADAVMLSAESAAGRFPVGAVETMVRIAEQIEQDPRAEQQLANMQPLHRRQKSDAIAAAAREISISTDIAAISCHTMSGSTAYRVAQQRPGAPIVAVTSEMETARQLALVWGVSAKLCPPVERFREAAIAGARAALDIGIAQASDSVVVTAGVPLNTQGTTNILRIVRADCSDIDIGNGKGEGSE